MASTYPKLTSDQIPDMRANRLNDILQRGISKKGKSEIRRSPVLTKGWESGSMGLPLVWTALDLLRVCKWRVLKTSRLSPKPPLHIIMAGYEEHPSEETPLLQRKAKTPLPWDQLNITLLAVLAEPISSTYIFPFINQLIGQLGVTGGDDRKIGYYAGLIESLFFVTQAATILQWGRLSDFIGRKPVILLGLLGLSMSNFAFGLSKTLDTLIISRCIAGVLNGNIGVMKSTFGDITDHSNIAQVFALMPVTFSVGATIAPLYGGALVKPQDRWPKIFRGKFWTQYPYFLPCAVSGSFSLITFLICLIWMKESLPSKTKRGKKPTEIEQPTIRAVEDDLAVDARPVPISTLLRTYSVVIPIANYGILALVEIGLFVLLPLFYSSPIAIGGLGFPPSIIGTFLAVFGIVDGTIQALFAAKIIEKFGAKNLFCSSILAFYPLVFIFPVMSAVVTAQRRVGPLIWFLLAVQLVLLVVMDLAYTVIFIFTARASPNKQSLGTTNGLSQTLASIARAIGPAFATSLFAFSKQYNVLGGNLVYVGLAILTTILVLLSQHLPELKDDSGDE